MKGSHTPVWPQCGCFILVGSVCKYLPQVNVEAHARILSSTSRTTLVQTFVNPNQDSSLDRVSYTFPLYDGVSVVAFTCTIGSRVITGVVKGREAAKSRYDAAVKRGEMAGLMEQSHQAADVFTTKLGNVPSGATIKVEVTYLGELQHDAEVDGLRYVIPTCIAPRYSSSVTSGPWYDPHSSNVQHGTISFTVDVEMPGGSAIKKMQSPSHPISVTIGTTSTTPDAEPSLRKASASLALGSTEMDKDFVVMVVATNLGNPVAILETHPDLPNQRALMTTLVPKFNLPTERPEIVFVCDRSGSMTGKIPNLINALQLFLKSLPLGVKFNVCSFGSKFDFLWDKSQSYKSETLEQAIQHVNSFGANYGGTEIHHPIEATFKRRYKDMNLEVFLLTDGEIWNQQGLFDLINKEIAVSKGAVRVFTLGVGGTVSHSLIEGVARAGNGFSQSVGPDEKMEKKLIRMLKASLTPHITDYKLEIKYRANDDDDDDFELVERVQDALNISDTPPIKSGERDTLPRQPISLFDTSINTDDGTGISDASSSLPQDSHLPKIEAPRYLQTPLDIPPLFPFSRTTVYVLLSEQTPNQVPHSVLLKASSIHGPLELEIPITFATGNAATIHQLAARKAVKELEEGRGWIFKARNTQGKLLKEVYEGRFPDMVEREAIRLGLKYQVAGRWTSFVAVENDGETKETREISEVPQGQEQGTYDVEPNPDMRTRRISGLPMGASSSGMMALASSSIPIEHMARRAQGLPPPSFMLQQAQLGAPLQQQMQQHAQQYAQQQSMQQHAQQYAQQQSMQQTLPQQQILRQLRPVQMQATQPFPQYAVPVIFADSMSHSTRHRKKARKAYSKSHADEHQTLTKNLKTSYGAKESSYSSGLASVEDFPDTLSRLVNLQTFSGKWEWTNDLFQVLGVSADEVAKLAVPGNTQDKQDVLATVCAVVYLKIRLASEEDSWEMLVEKARQWMEAETGVSADELERVVEHIISNSIVPGKRPFETEDGSADEFA